MSEAQTPVVATITLIEVYQSEPWCVYGLWRIDGVGKVGCCVGVPEYLRGTAASAASWRGVTDAWYADPSDWMGDSASVRDVALNILKTHAYALVNTDRSELYAGVEL